MQNWGPELLNQCFEGREISPLVMDDTSANLTVETEPILKVVLEGEIGIKVKPEPEPWGIYKAYGNPRFYR